MPVPPTPAGKVRLTDQAAVAVHLARALAGAGRPTVGHLVAALLGEPDGLASHDARRHTGAGIAVRMSTHPGLSAPGLAPLTGALVAVPVSDVPAWTVELLAAARRVGGGELEDLLDHAGVTLGAPVRPHTTGELESMVEEGLPLETFGLGSRRPEGITVEADLLLARARALGGGSRWLLAVGLQGPLADLDAETDRALRLLPEVDADDVADHAVAVAEGPPVDVADLVRAVLGAGLAALHVDG